MTDWKETALWKRLETASGPEVDAARALLIQEMPRIQTILTQAHTAPTDFTLHDADHSFRVAKWMAKITPDDVLEKLSPYEITLLLLAAYLHDIGMTPEQGRVERFWGHLVYGAPDPESLRQPLTDEEARDLQRWLDDDGRDLTIPLAPDGTVSEANKRLADLLIAHYCRHKHNDWSGEWIKANLRPEALPRYETWVDDLVQLCRSHHERYDELRQSRFDPRLAGPSGRPIHHRYLACVLRVADVLEIDPERTPEVIFRHREIHPGSVLYWRKDHENWIFTDGNRLVLTAYPESALIENAIRKTAADIQRELATSARLKPLFRWELLTSQDLPHQWDFPEVLTIHVQPRNDAYVYIDGAFRPNTEKLLELLSGTQLYGNPLAAARELLQNAFDAVKEEMAYQRLERPNEPEFAQHLAATHRVELRLEERDGRRWLACKDTGVGMTRRIIEDYLLVSGNSRRREMAELERRCQHAGFRLGRTGQFGIGVLSYFMLADRVEIRTRRSAARVDAETTGWSFVTEGVGSFGELKRTPSVVGTEIYLRLRKEFEEAESFEWELRDYLKRTIRYIPCTLALKGLGSVEDVISWKAGWTHSLEEPTRRLFAEMWQGRFIGKESPPEWLEVAQEALRWRVEEGEIPGNLGTYRISVPWFELPGGRCEAFMYIQSKAQQKVIARLEGYKTGFLPRFDLVESIHGISLEKGDDPEEIDVGFREINWESAEAGSLSVDRSHLNASPLAYNAIEWVKVRAFEILAEILTEEPSEYIFLSEIWLKGLGAEPWWALGNPWNELTELVWGPVSFPVAPGVEVGLLGTPVYFRGKKITKLFALPFQYEAHFEPSFFQMSPHKLVAKNLQSPSFGVVRLWERLPDSHGRYPLGEVARFSPKWRRLCGVRLGNAHKVVWNVNHPVVLQVDEDSLRWLKQSKDPNKNIDFVALGKDILATQGRASSVLTWVFKSRETEHIWTMLLESAPSLAERLLVTALGSSDLREEEMSIGFLKQLGRWALIVLTANSVIVASPGDPFFEEFLPDPGPDWVITEGD